MALVRKTDKLKEEIQSRLIGLQKEKTYPLLVAAIPTMIRCLFHWFNAEGFPIKDDEYALIEKLRKIKPKGYLMVPKDLHLSFLPQNDPNILDLAIKTANQTHVEKFVQHSVKLTSIMNSVDISGFERSLALPAYFDTQFNINLGGMLIYINNGSNGKTDFTMSFITDETMAMDSINTVQATGYFPTTVRPADLDRVITDPELLDNVNEIRTQVNHEYGAVDKVHEYIFKTLWPGCSSLNGMTRYFPGIMEFVSDETRKRFYKRTGTAPVAVPDHLAPPSEVLVTTAKTKLLK